jgi:hypothetical protein
MAATPRELEVIELALRLCPESARIEELEAVLQSQFNFRFSRRTLQRNLHALISVSAAQSNQMVRKTGAGRATRYHLVASHQALLDTTLAPAAMAQFEAAALTEATIPLSTQGKYLQYLVQQPLSRRQPVGYNPEFLNAYRPNTFFYLPSETRAELAAAGQAAGELGPAGTFARHVANRLLIDLSWNSSRLEGNTYSLLETERLLSMGQVADGKATQEAQMILNHKDAIEFLIGSASEIDFNRHTILNLHAMLSDGLLIDPQAGGRLRRIAVGVSQTVFHPLEVPQRIEAYFNQALSLARAIKDPFEQAFFAMVHLPYLQPFEDVNKRVSRLAANIALIKHNVCPLSFVDVPHQLYLSAMVAVYERNQIELLRDVFVWAYKRSCARYSAVRQSLGEPDPIRVQYRQHIIDLVSTVVRSNMSKSQAIDMVQLYVQQHIASADRLRVTEMVDNQLLHLHEGSIARYRLRPSEYSAWKHKWGQ